MINSSQIKPDAQVLCSKDGAFAVVDHMEGNDVIKLKKDKQGQHHYIPLKWVTKVDDKVHIDRPGDQAMKEWSTTPNIKTPGFAWTDAAHAKKTDIAPKAMTNASGKSKTENKPHVM